MLLFVEQPNQNSGGILLGGSKGIELEPNLNLPFENEDVLLPIKDLLEAIEAMERSKKEN